MIYENKRLDKVSEYIYFKLYLVEIILIIYTNIKRKYSKPEKDELAVRKIICHKSY